MGRAVELEALIKQKGFVSTEECHRLILAVDLSSTQKMIAFKLWKFRDGTKEGLLKLHPDPTSPEASKFTPEGT